MFGRVKEMTPARFDIVYVVYEHVRMRGQRETGSIWQATIHRALGLARQTVWKAIVRLVELGFLEKKVDPESKVRRILVKPTEEGIRWIRRAYGVALTERFAVPSGPDGAAPPRHAYRMARDHAYRAKRSAKIIAKLKLPGFEDLGQACLPPKVGREVARAFSARFWALTPRGGRRGRRYLDTLDKAISSANQLAKTFGDTSEVLYLLRYDPEYIPRSRDAAEKDVRDPDDQERAVESGGSDRRSDCCGSSGSTGFIAKNTSNTD